jgi:hypothetical protein
LKEIIAELALDQEIDFHLLGRILYFLVFLFSLRAFLVALRAFLVALRAFLVALRAFLVALRFPPLD